MKTNITNIGGKIVTIILDILMIAAIILIMFGVYYLIEIKALNNEYANLFRIYFF